MQRTSFSIFSISLAALLLFRPGLAGAQNAVLTVDASQPGHRVSPSLWGIFFEDINLSADGGLYPELVRNRSFEDADQPLFWTLASEGEAKCSMATEPWKQLNPFNSKNLRVKIEGAGSLENAGYWGMNIVGGDSYAFKLAARGADGFSGPLTVRVLSSSDKCLMRGEIPSLSSDWNYYYLDLTASASDPHARLQICFAGRGSLWLDMVSLVPKKTWKNHGLRPDLAEALMALKPSFLRFPGGCWVEGEDRAHMYNWKRTVGDLDSRTSLYNIWGYNATHGLGFYEYLQMAEDLGAAPVFCVNVGMSHREVVPMGQMALWVRDAMDAIEYANGSTNSYWGGQRAKAGHPGSFGLKTMEIGNENGGAAYRERWPLFVKAIKSEYAEVQLIANHWQGGYPQNPMPELVDEHYYDSPEFFMNQASRYDQYDRSGPKVFVGEFAVTKGCGKGNLRAAIGEAAFMTGLERNSDVVSMACYAPLLVNINHRKWNPDLINFDSSRWYGIPSYYVQKLFSENRGDVTVPITVQSGKAEESMTGCIGVGTWDTQAEFKDIKVTSPDGKVLFASDFAAGTNGWRFLGDGEWTVTEGALRQTGEKEAVRAVAGSKLWTDYTLELKARKIAGQEGFLILFRLEDDDSRSWWNIGGWGNTQHGIEIGTAPGAPLTARKGSVEAGRWYDVRVEVKGNSGKCWLDGQLMHQFSRPPQRVKALYASATREEKSGDLILKVVNASAAPVPAEINLNGLKVVSGPAQVSVLTGAPGDENDLDEPVRVSPKTEVMTLSGANLTRSFPGNSLTVLRIPTQK